MKIRQMTDHELKLAIAREFPAIVHRCHNHDAPCIHWTDTKQVVTDREWLAVMHEVEGGMAGGVKGAYYANKLPRATGYGIMSVDYQNTALITHATWQQRAEATLRTINKWEASK
jgi:hypothetical protein